MPGASWASYQSASQQVKLTSPASLALPKGWVDGDSSPFSHANAHVVARNQPREPGIVKLAAQPHPVSQSKYTTRPALPHLTYDLPVLHVPRGWSVVSG